MKQTSIMGCLYVQEFLFYGYSMNFLHVEPQRTNALLYEFSPQVLKFCKNFASA